MSETMINPGIEQLLRDMVAIVSELKADVKNDREQMQVVVKSVETLAKAVNSINVKLETHIATNENKVYECEKEFEKTFVRNDNLKEWHDNAHIKIEKDRNLKSSNFINYVKIVGWVFVASVVVYLVLFRTGIIQ